VAGLIRVCGGSLLLSAIDLAAMSARRLAEVRAQRKSSWRETGPVPQCDGDVPGGVHDD
jgi:hypothetical protein